MRVHRAGSSMWLQLLRSRRKWAACSCCLGVGWCDEGNEDGSSCPQGASADAVCQLGALSTACCLPASSEPLGADFTRGGWICTTELTCFQPPHLLRRVFSGCRTALWQWYCCFVRLLAGLYKPVWSSLDGKERVSRWAEWETSSW